MRGLLWVKGDGRRRLTEQIMNQQNKNPMKTKTSPSTITNQPTINSGLGSESDRQNLPTGNPESANGLQRSAIDFAKRQTNRQLGTKDLLTLLRSEAPRFYELAEVVGKWVWIQFPEKQPSTITARLAEFGFHWNNKRQLWQHPCGPVTVEASPDDPREKYGSVSARAACTPADLQPA
jgi:hypothetical protein